MEKLKKKNGVRNPPPIPPTMISGCTQVRLRDSVLAKLDVLCREQDRSRIWMANHLLAKTLGVEL